MTRPKLEEGEARDESIRVPVNAREGTAIRALAKKRKRPVAEVVRAEMMAAAEREGVA